MENKELNIEEELYIDGEEAIRLNEACRKYDRLKATFEEAEAEFKEVQKVIKELCTHKANKTSKFSIKMTITSESSILDGQKVKEKYPEVFAECQKVKKGSVSIREVLKR